MQVLSERIKDPRVISLIHSILRTKIMEKGVAKVSTIGTPQGGMISPILANILLNELDQELEKRGHKFVRYADDMIIFCKSERSAYRTFKSISKFIESKLFLKVNKDKTKVGRINRNYKFLGYCFTATVDSYGKVTAKARVHRKSVTKCKKQLIKLLDRRAPGGFKETRKRLNYFTRGWFNYFSLHFIHAGRNLFNRLDEQIRRRIRVMYWKQWKTPQQRKKKLAQYKNHDSIDCYSSARYQRVAMILKLVITNKVIECQHGWDTFNVLINKYENRTQMYGYKI